MKAVKKRDEYIEKFEGLQVFALQIVAVVFALVSPDRHASGHNVSASSLAITFLPARHRPPLGLDKISVYGPRVNGLQHQSSSPDQVG